MATTTSTATPPEDVAAMFYIAQVNRLLGEWGALDKVIQDMPLPKRAPILAVGYVMHLPPLETADLLARKVGL